MSPTWAPNLAGVIDNGFGGSRGSDTVDGIVLHHTANGGGASALGYVAGKNSRNSHPTYLVKTDGEGWGIVNPARRPFSTANGIDTQCVSFEVDNAAGAPNWDISEAALEEVAQITLHHYRESPRYGHGIARNIPGVVQHEFFVAWHSQYVATTCPGPSMIAHLDSIIARVLELDKPPVASNVTVAVGAVVGVSGPFEVYGNATDASTGKNGRALYPAGNYIVFKVAGGAVNLTRKPGTPGGWALMANLGLTPPVVEVPVDPPVDAPPVTDPPVKTPPVSDPPIDTPPVITDTPIDYSKLPDEVVNTDGSINVPLPDGTDLKVSDIPTYTLPLTTAAKARVTAIGGAVLTALEVAAQIIPDGQTRLWVMLAAGVLTIASTAFGVYTVPNLPKITKSKF